MQPNSLLTGNDAWYDEQSEGSLKCKMHKWHKDLYEEKALDQWMISGIKNLGWWKLPITKLQYNK